MTESSTSGRSSEWASERLDALFAALADEQCRQVLGYFRTTGDDAASVEELVTYTIEEGTGDTTREQLELTFHHVTLPKLADLGVIEYDARSRAVCYRGSRTLERILAVVAAADPPTE